jgi:serine phosphatase RsbU (regulator of sigma subunit)
LAENVVCPPSPLVDRLADLPRGFAGGLRMASLLILKGANQGLRLPLENEKTILGRDPSCDVVIPGTAVSRRHAVITRVAGTFYIEDGNGAGEKSRNGTMVNNDAVPFPGRVPLNDNDRIKICDFLCTFQATKPVKPLPPELRKEEPEPPEEPGTSTTVEAALSNVGSNALLETQPAEKLRVILDITTNLSKTLDLDSLLPKIVDSMFALFRQADRGFIILREEGSNRLIPKAIKTRRPTDEASARFSRRIVNQCLDRVQALLSDDATSDTRFAMSQSIADFRIRSVMCAPLWFQSGTAFGVIQLDTQDRAKKFTQEDLKLLMGVATQASIALENAKLHQDQVARVRLQREMELAREVQRGFLPLRAPVVPGYEFFAHYQAALEVGGDYYDFIPLPQNRLAVMVGDVAGKGVPAALLMAKISSDARFCMLTEPDPATAISKLNHLFHQAGLTERFVTLVAASLDPADHSVTLVNAGHPSPLVYRKVTMKCEEAVPLEMSGLPIAVAEGYGYTACRVRLEPHDSIVIFTDGVTDAMDTANRQFQIKGIKAAIEGGSFTPRTLGQRLVQAVARHMAGSSAQHDDISLVCFGRG